MQQVLDQGVWQENRTGIRTKMIPGAMLKFDMVDGFPAVTTKKLAFGAVKGELLGFLRGFTSAAQFREFGCKVWDENSNKNEAWLNNPNRKGEDDLGRIYSAQYTDWKTSRGGSLNQIANLVSEIKTNPSSRRLLVTAWRPDEFDLMSLPSCHFAYQVIIEQDSKKMHLLWNQRSCDLFLGIPFNIGSYSLLLHLLAKTTGYIPGIVTGFLADVHIYENHLDQVKEQLSREPRPLPNLVLDPVITLDTPLDWIHPDMINLENYDPHPPIKAPMAV